MSWVERVLAKKGLHSDVINRMRRYYKNWVTIPVINNIQGKKIQNTRRTLRQGDCPSSIWFNYGIDPLIVYLDKRLQGITILSSPVSGPAMKHHKRKLQPIESRYSVIGYCDYIKPAVTSIKELHIIDQGARLFENASGCCLHQDPKSDKCKILLLGGWSDLHQDQIPLDYLKISDHLDMLGVVIY